MGLSAKRLGEYLGLTSEQTNVLLKERGFLDGEPGNYYPTEKGKQLCIERGDDNGYGGYAFRGWNWIEWDESMLNLLAITPEERNAIIQKASEQRLARRRENKKASELYWQDVERRKRESFRRQSVDNSENSLTVGVVIVAILGIIKLIRNLSNK